MPRSYEDTAAVRPRVLVVDDDGDLRAATSLLLERAGFETAHTGDGDEAVQLADIDPPDVVVLDVNLPGTSGYAVCSELRERFGDELSIIFVSGERTEAFDRVGGLLLGADDYVVKPFDPDELIARVRRFSDRRRRLATPRRLAAGSAAKLTPREREILALLVDGLTQGEIAERLVISPKTVATHIQRTLEKLGVHSRAQAVALVAREQLLGDDSVVAHALAGESPAAP
jgi:RNA polymerase sigma factor (sigma-70 family)